MFCSACGTQNEDENKFCKKCGNALTHYEKKSNNKIYIFIIIAIAVVAIIAIVFACANNKIDKINLTGIWVDDRGIVLEFLSDGTLRIDGKMSSLHPDVYEVLEEGYLKIGEWDGAWLTYDYTTFTIDSASKNRIELSYDQQKIILRRKDY